MAKDVYEQVDNTREDIENVESGGTPAPSHATETEGDENTGFWTPEGENTSAPPEGEGGN